MKVRDSGMPPEEMWSKFFDVEVILDQMHINSSIENLMEIGCGYGTFTIPAAKRISGNLFAFDIEQEMIDFTREKAVYSSTPKITFIKRDVIAEGSGLMPGSINYVMLFNILHHDNPMELLAEAYKVLVRGGKVGIIHWRSDIITPRGPDISIRPKPHQCIEWAEQIGFRMVGEPFLLEPYHFGLIIEKS